MNPLVQLRTVSTAECLQELSGLHFLSAKDAEVLLPYLEAVEIARGETLWNEGEQSAFAAFILSGRFEEKKATEFANKQIVVGIYDKGAMVGEGSLLDHLPRPLTATCLENAKLLTLSRNRFAALLQEQPQTAIQVLKGATLTLSMRLRKSYDRLAAIF
jgi:CRP-like cAMP-binding protein